MVLTGDESSGEAAGDGSGNAERDVGATVKSPNSPAVDDQLRKPGTATAAAAAETENELVEGPESSSSSSSSSSLSLPTDSSRRRSTINNNKESDLRVQKDEKLAVEPSISKRVKREDLGWQKSPRRRSASPHHRSPSESPASVDNEDDNSQQAKDPELLTASPDLNSAQLGHQQQQQRVIHPYLHLLPPVMRNGTKI